MIKYFYVKTTDLNCPMAHRLDCFPKEDAQINFPAFEKYDDRYLVTYIDGLDAPGASITSNEISNQDGSVFARSRVPERNITLKILFNPELEGPELVAARTDLNKIFGVGSSVQLYMVDTNRCFGGAEPTIIDISDTGWWRTAYTHAKDLFENAELWEKQTEYGIGYASNDVVKYVTITDDSEEYTYWLSLKDCNKSDPTLNDGSWYELPYNADGPLIFKHVEYVDYEEYDSNKSYSKYAIVKDSNNNFFESLSDKNKGNPLSADSRYWSSIPEQYPYESNNYYRWRGGSYNKIYSANDIMYGRPDTDEFDIISDNKASHMLTGEQGWTVTGCVETHTTDIWSNACYAQVTIRCFDPKLYYWAFNQLTNENILASHLIERRLDDGELIPDNNYLTNYYTGNKICVMNNDCTIKKWYKITGPGTYSEIINYDPYYLTGSSNPDWGTWSKSSISLELTTTRYRENAYFYKALSNNSHKNPKTHNEYWSSASVPAWDSGTQYHTNDIVEKDSRYFKAKNNNTNSPPSVCWNFVDKSNIALYNSSTVYNKDDIVKDSNSNYYYALENDFSGQTPKSSWKYLNLLLWDESRSYSKNDVVETEEKNLYKSTIDNLKSNPDAWEKIPDVAYNASTSYSKNDIVKYNTGGFITWFESLVNNNVGHDPSTSSGYWSQIDYDIYDKDVSYDKDQYALYTAVGEGSSLAKSLIDNNQNNDFIHWEKQNYSIWNAQATYSENDIILYDNDFYKSLINSNVGQSPTPYWAKIGTWNSGDIYSRHAYVLYNNYIYKSTRTNQGQTPSADWSIYEISIYDPNTEYSVNDYVKLGSYNSPTVSEAIDPVTCKNWVYIDKHINYIYGIEFHDSCGIPLVVSWQRGINKDVWDQSAANRLPAIRMVYDEMSINYIAPLSTSILWYMNFDKTKYWKKSFDKAVMVNNSFLDDEEQSVKSWNIYLDAGRLQYRNAILYDSYVQNPHSENYKFAKANEAISYVPPDSESWPFIPKGAINSARIRLEFSDSADAMKHDGEAGALKNAFACCTSHLNNHYNQCYLCGTGIRLDPYKMGV